MDEVVHYIEQEEPEETMTFGQSFWLLAGVCVAAIVTQEYVAPGAVELWENLFIFINPTTVR